MTSLLAVLLVFIALPDSTSGQAMKMTMPAPLSEKSQACLVSESRRAGMMGATYDTFDQTSEGTTNWRAVTSVGCYATGARLIVDYLAKNKGQLSPEQLRTLNFHVGQVLLLGRQDSDAAPFLERAGGGPEREWNLYVDVTLAFVRRNRLAFDQARASYDSVAPSSPRRGVLAKLASCFEKPYADAVACSKP